MKKIITYPLMIVLGVGLGVGSALKMTGIIGTAPLEKLANIDVNHWLSDWNIGAPSATAYLRARVAKRGLLALSKSEAVYFTRNRDDDGNRLIDTCQYEISGKNQDVRWWSITLYDFENRLPNNTDGALSIDATQIAENAGSSDEWSALISTTRPQIEAQTGHWISSRNARAFDLTLRLYLPSQALLDNPQMALNPPSVKKLQCKTGDAS